MGTEPILSLLIAERDKLNRAIEALQGQAARRGRPSANNSNATGTPGTKRFVSAASRRKMALAQKKRWAAVRAAKAKQ